MSESITVFALAFVLRRYSTRQLRVNAKGSIVITKCRQLLSLNSYLLANEIGIIAGSPSPPGDAENWLAIAVRFIAIDLASFPIIGRGLPKLGSGSGMTEQPRS